MNMTDPVTSGILQFSTNPWVLFVIALGGILIVIGYSTSFFKYIYDYSTRPKLSFETAKTVIDDPKNEQKIVSLWVYVTNHGKQTARQCSAQILATNYSQDFLIGQMSSPSRYGTLPIKWHIGNQLYDTLDINPQLHAGVLKIPVSLTIPTKEEKDKDPWIAQPMTGLKFEDPLEKLNPVGSLAPSEKEEGKLMYHILCTVFIHYQSTMFYKQFEIKSPMKEAPMNIDEITFTEI